ncbi:MAG: hypothetical protein AB7O59_09100 [Pirellulales bacterium]
MACESNTDAAHVAGGTWHATGVAWSPREFASVQGQLDAIAHGRPSAFVGVLEYWLATPLGESHFDVKG